MSRHDDRVRLRHTLDHAREAVFLLEGKTKTRLKRTRLLQLGLTRGESGILYILTWDGCRLRLTLG